MISFKLFVEAIHHAIVSASDSLMDKNEGLLDKYFEKPVDIPISCRICIFILLPNM